MRTAVFLRNVVGKAKHAFVIGVGPLQCCFNLNIAVVVAAAERNDAFVQRRFRFVDVVDKGRQSALIVHHHFARFGAAVVNQLEINAGIEKRLFTDASFQRFKIEFGHGKGFRRRQKSNFGAVTAVGFADNFQMFGHAAVGKRHHMFVALAPDAQPQPGRQCVDHRNADAVQTARDLVRVVVKLAARVQLGHNDFGGRNPFFLMHADRNSAAVVADGGRTVGIEDNFGFVAVTGERFVDGVIQNFINHMMQAGAVIGVADVHSRTFANRVQPAQNLNRIGIIFLFFPIDFGLCHIYHKCFFLQINFDTFLLL